MSAAAPIDPTPAAPTPAAPAPAAPPAAPAPTTPFKFAAPPAPAGAPAPSAPPPAAPEPITLAPWMGELDQDSATYVKGKGWLSEGKTFADVVKAHRAAESKLGRPPEQLLVKPDWSKPESVAEFRAALGVPAEPTGYETPNVPMPEGLIDAPRLSSISHVLGLTPEQHALFAQETSKFFMEAYAEHAANLERQNAAELAKMQKDYGGNWDAFQQSVQEAISALGISEDNFAAARIMLGERPAQELLAKISAGMREHVRPDDGKPGAFTPMTVEVAQSKLRELQRDPAFIEDLKAGGMREAKAKAQWAELLAIIGGGS